MWLDKLRQKNKSTKEQYAFFGAFLVTAFIAGIWVLSFTVDIKAFPAKIVSEDQAAEKVSDDFGRSAFGNFFSDAKANLASLVDSISAEVEEVKEEPAEEFDPVSVLEKLKSQTRSTTTSASSTDATKTGTLATSSATSSEFRTGRIVKLEARGAATATATSSPNNQ